MASRPAKPGRLGRPRKFSLSGRSGKSGQSGQRTLNKLASFIHALLAGTLEQFHGSTLADEGATCMDSSISSHPQCAAHKRCELEPDLASTTLSLFCSCVLIALPAALARLLGHQDSCQL